MSYPCINATYFDVTAPGIISPKRAWQWDLRATAEVAPTTFTPASNAGGTVLQTAMATWTNTTGVTQNVYGTMTYGTARLAVDALKEPVIEWTYGVSAGVAPPDPTLSETSRLRIKPDLGTGTISSTTVAIYYLEEERCPPGTVPVGDVTSVPAGQVFKCKAQCRWLTLSWGLDWYSGYGNPVPERIGEVGGLRMDIFSTPVIP